MGIVALGVGFYAGLRMTAPDMELAADRYCDGTNLYDIRVLSTLGFSEDDVTALAELDGIEAIMPAYQTDVLAQANGEQTAIRVHSLCESAASSYSENAYSVTSEDVNYLNRLILVSGTWPTSANECVVSADSPNVVLSVGDTIYVTEASTNLEDVLTCTEYTRSGHGARFKLFDLNFHGANIAWRWHYPAMHVCFGQCFQCGIPHNRSVSAGKRRKRAAKYE